MTITPWLLMKIARGRFEGVEAHEGGEHDVGAMGRFYKGLATKLLTAAKVKAVFALCRSRDASLLHAVPTKSVRVKLLPFDNKSEIAVVVDLPRGASLEETDRLLTARPSGSRICQNLPRSSPIRGRPRRSTSMGSCAIITCAKRRRWVICRSIFCPRTSANGPATRSRSISANGWKRFQSRRNRD